MANAPSSDDSELQAALAASLEEATEAEQLAEAMRISASIASAPQHGLPQTSTSEFAMAALVSAVSEADAIALVNAISASDAASEDAADAARLEAALQASLAEARVAEGMPPNAAVPSIHSRQRSRETYPAFTSVPPAVVRGVSTECELAEELVGSGDVAPVIDPFPFAGGAIDVSDNSSSVPSAAPLVAQQTSGEVRALAARLDEEERAAREAAEVGPSFACGICLEDAVPLLAGHRLRCGHIFCTPCIGEHVKVKIRAHDISADALTCPSCVAAIPVADVHALTWRCGDDDSWHRFEAAADAAMIESLVRDGGARRCPSEHCNYAFVWSDGDPRDFECPACSARFCLACPCVDGGVGPAHPGQSCAEYAEKLRADEAAKRRLEEWRAENARADERFRELMRREMRAGDTKPCPNCKQPITKNGGCHHHLCSWCKVKFCWNCGGFNRHRPNQNTCSTTCSRAERRWWAESELLPAAPPANASSSTVEATDHLRSRLWSIYRSLGGANGR